MDPQVDPVAVTSVTAVPMVGGAAVPDQTIVVEQGHITAMGRTGEVALPQNAREIDGTGRWLMPGLADMHAHYGEAGQFIMFLAGGVTRIRNMWGNNFHLSLIKLIEAGDFPGPHINTTGPITDRPVRDGKGLYPGTALIEDPDDASDLVAGFAAAGYHALKVYSYLTPECLRALGRAAADHGLPMVGHCPNGVSWEEAMDAGMTSFEHLLEIGTGHLCQTKAPAPALGNESPTTSPREQMRMRIEQLDRDAVRRLAGQLADRNVWNCPTITVSAQFTKDPDEALGHHAMRYLPTATREQWARRARRVRGGPEDAAEAADLMRRSVDLNIELVGLLHEEGAPLLLGTDAGSPLTPQGFTIVDELEYFVSAGLSPYEAIATGTTAVARYLGRDDFGTVEVGKAADLLLLDADPLADVSAVRRISAVFSNGFLFERSDLDRLLTWREENVEATVDLPESELGPMATKTWWAR